MPFRPEYLKQAVGNLAACQRLGDEFLVEKVGQQERFDDRGDARVGCLFLETWRAD
jgi:hypothetical protein